MIDSYSQIYKKINNNWRKKPFKICGGVKDFFSPSISIDQFHDSVTFFNTYNPKRVIRDKDDVIFIQNFEQSSRVYKRYTQSLSKLFKRDKITLDAVYTKNGRSIGSHVDASDNIVLNLSGTKQWRLCSPSSLDYEFIKKRLLQEPGIGSVEFPEDGLSFTLNSGDLLYIPLMWIHWGISVGEALSISIVLNLEKKENVNDIAKNIYNEFNNENSRKIQSV